MDYIKFSHFKQKIRLRKLFAILVSEARNQK